MKKKLYTIPMAFVIGLFLLLLHACTQKINPESSEKDGYDEPAAAALFQKMRTHDPATGEIPSERMWDAIIQTKAQKDNSSNLISALNWTERGSNADVVGATNGNTRANSGVTSGRIDAIWVDKNDATGKTVWIGGRGGGLWKTTDITLAPATWTLANDYMGNLSVMAITQDPANPNIMYFCTGESFYESGALRGNGVFKSTDGGITWAQLSSTNNSTYYYCTRILCDYLGNVYVGTRSGLFRSTVASGGAVWTNITPTGVSVGVSDLEISSTSVPGRLHGLFGIQAALTSRYTDIPETVAVGTWTSPVTTLPSASIRAEMAVSGNTLYCLPSNSSSQVPTVYKSTDGGANWATAGSTPNTATANPFANGQGWYNLAVAINPANANECIIGGIDNAKTTNGGTSWTRISDWVGTSGQYVHADQHASIWYDNGTKLLLGGDGGIFYSADGGTTFRDRNVGLRIKQFYSCAIDPVSTNYFLAGAQDNGTHSFNSPGIGGSVEVLGGDGAYVAIDQNEPQFQTGAYVYCNFRRSSNSGATWSSGASNNNGRFINPYDYDNTANKVYASYTAGNFLRWEDPQSGFTYTTVPVTAFASQSIGAVAVSPFTANCVYFGMASGGKIIKVDGANGASPAGTDITGAGMPTSSVYMNCINTGSSDQFLVACYSNYGVANIWVSSNGGTSWTNVDGNLPDMPVYYAIYHPDDNTKMIIATETGVWETDLLNGGSTVWMANTGFPTVRTTMFKYRSSDKTLLASTYGRGLWTATINASTTPDIQFQTPTGSATESTTSMATCSGYTDYSFNMNILNAPTGNATVTLNIQAGATATAGVDYMVTTNGNFAAPSMLLSFASGSTASQSFSIRVFDDAAIEAVESFTINYSITGSTNAQPGSSNQSFVFSIADNDAAPLAPASLSGTIGSNSANLTQPFRGSFFDARTQVLYTAAELTALGFTSGNITSIGFNVVTKSSTQPYSGFTIKLKNTATTALVTGPFEAGTTTVYSGNYSTVAGLNTLPITPFLWDGTSNLLMEMCYDNTTGTADDLIAGSTGGANTHFDRQSSNATPGCSIANSVYTFATAARPVVTINISILGNPVSTALNSSKTAYMGPYDEVYFYDGGGNIMARVKNLGAFDYGCTQVIVDRAGTATVPFWNGNPSNYLASKSFKVIPTNNTATGNYQISLYYTAAEISGWMAATGYSLSAAQVVKVSNGFYIPDVTPAAPQVSSVSFTPITQAAFGAHYRITGDFNNHWFSGFGMGVAGFPLPVGINYFTGTKQNNHHLLNWKVTCVTSPRATMVLERGTDGRNFTGISSIAADALRCQQPFNYTDANPLKGINYYRLKVTDADGKVSYSSQVALMNAAKGFELIGIAPNPVVGKTLSLQVTSAQAVAMNISIIDMQGKQVLKKLLNILPGFSNLPVNVESLPAGTYSLQTVVDGDKLKTLRFVKQ